jgi:hypothetical protein
MFNAKIFVETAERLQLEAAELQRQRENAEIAALGAAKVGAKGEGEQEQTKEVEVSQEDVEKFLIQLFSSGESRSPFLPPEVIFTMLWNNENVIQSCQLTEYERTGLIAEMSHDIGANGQVVFSEYVKRVVPVIFDMRRNQLLSAYLQEGSFETLQIPSPDLKQLDSIFPLMPPGWKKKEKEQEANDPGTGSEHPRRSGCRVSGRRPSKAGGDNLGSGPRLSGRRPTKAGADNPEDAMRVQGRAKLQVGHPTLQRRKSKEISKELSNLVVKDTPNGRGYQRRRVMLGFVHSVEA